jgi:hypothetical protein
MRILKTLVYANTLIIALYASLAAAQTIAASAEDRSIAAAARVKQEISRREQDIALLQADMIQKLETAVNGTEDDPFVGAKGVIQQLKPLVHQLNATSQQLLGNQDAYFEALRGLHQAIRESPEVFRTAGDVFDGYAAEEPYEEIKKDYRSLAESWRLIADEMVRRDQGVQQFGRDAVEFKKHLARTALFLDRLEMFLNSCPDLGASEGGDDFARKLQGYIHGFESLRGSLRSFHDKLKTGTTPGSASIRPSDAALRNEHPSAKEVARVRFFHQPSNSPEEFP